MAARACVLETIYSVLGCHRRNTGVRATAIDVLAIRGTQHCQRALNYIVQFLPSLVTIRDFYILRIAKNVCVPA
jgi:hypothetical protein